ncbi:MULTISPECIES: hypothetical protein [unclassified Luteococcus]
MNTNFVGCGIKRPSIERAAINHAEQLSAFGDAYGATTHPDNPSPSTMV